MCMVSFAGTWQQDSYGWWYRHSDGSYPVSQWMQDSDGKWYHFNENGYMQTGWLIDGGKWYYLNDDGSMLVNGMTPDGYYVGNDGGWNGSKAAGGKYNAYTGQYIYLGFQEQTFETTWYPADDDAKLLIFSEENGVLYCENTGGAMSESVPAKYPLVDEGNGLFKFSYGNSVWSKMIYEFTGGGYMVDHYEEGYGLYKRR